METDGTLRHDANGNSPKASESMFVAALMRNCKQSIPVVIIFGRSTSFALVVSNVFFLMP